jgi:hypothetical protein
VTVVHFPPGTSKWNRIEHRLFAYITQNWRGKPLVSHKVIIQLIAATSTEQGLTVTCDIDRSCYPRGIKISKAELAAINIKHRSFHGEWNYTIKPHKKKPTKTPIEAIITRQILSTPVGIVPDSKWPGMYRLWLRGGGLSDMYNLTWAGAECSMRRKEKPRRLPDRNRKRNSAGVTTIHAPTTGGWPAIGTAVAVEGDRRINLGRARKPDPNIAWLFLGTIYAAEADMLPDQPPDQFGAIPRPGVRDLAV